MKTYELTYIVSPEITAEEAEAKAKEIESLVLGKEGAIVRQSNPLAKTFSYPIGKSASGFFGVLEFHLEPEKIAELEGTFSKDGKIVRHMLIIKEAAKPRKERRTRISPMPAIEHLPAQSGKAEQIKETKKEEKTKVELKDIEQTLDEILGE